MSKHDTLQEIVVLTGTLIDKADNDDPNLPEYWLIYKTAQQLMEM